MIFYILVMLTNNGVQVYPEQIESIDLCTKMAMHAVAEKGALSAACIEHTETLRLVIPGTKL